jgi:NitT/TauT family transport system permease protein
MRRRMALALWLPAVTMVAWQTLASTGRLDPVFFPAPTTLARTAWEMLRHGDLLTQAKQTLARTFIGFTAGSSLGLACGLAMGGVPAVAASLEPAISAVYATPNLTLLPMLMIFFGVGDTAGIVLIATGCFLLLAVQALHAVRGVERCYVEMAANYGATRMGIVRRVYFPACLPAIFTGLQLGLGRALVIAVSVELVNGSSGLGGMIWMAWQTLSTERLYVGVAMTALLGVGFGAGLRRVQSRLVRWDRQAI